ncbi:type IV secretory system conjugative DNA transfer family protein [Cryptosporangium sp. NPDC048952]|uniref:type IV secretory system conjugative DNA transfer family protein n=1 Tax=Cryptosporangium sp. NPDC048952 TaxID=3363961 RepID=UPI0037123A00
MTGPDHPRRARGVPGARRAAEEPGGLGGLGGRVLGVTNAGPRRPIGVSTEDARHHLHVLGPTGTGKTSLLVRLALQDAEAGRGLVVFDLSAKGDLVTDLLDRLPAACGNRLVVIDPAEQDAPPSLNLLDPRLHTRRPAAPSPSGPGVAETNVLDATGGAGGPHLVAARLSEVMGRVWSRWWGSRTADIAHHGLLTLAHTPGATLAQLPRLLSDRAWRARRVGALAARLPDWESTTLAEFWAGLDELSTGGRAALVAPLLSRLRLVLSHPFAVALFGTPATTVSLADVLDGGVLLVRLPRGLIGEDGARLIGSLLLAAVWQAVTARAALPENRRRDASVIIDEAQHVLHLPIGIDDALAEARGLHVSFTLAHQYLGQLSDTMARAIDANARTKAYFALAPRDARDQARHLAPYLDESDLSGLGAFEIVLRPLADGRLLPPATATTLPPPPPISGRAEALRAAARTHTGLDQTTRRALRVGHLDAPARPAHTGARQPFPSERPFPAAEFFSATHPDASARRPLSDVPTEAAGLPGAPPRTGFPVAHRRSSSPYPPWASHPSRDLSDEPTTTPDEQETPWNTSL